MNTGRSAGDAPEPVGPTLRPIVCLVGPTGVGKTRLAVSLAERFGAEVINADSRQVYRGMDIGTAKPSADELARAPHHLVDILDPPESFGLANFLDLATKAVDEIASRGRFPIVAGGTGQYVWALAEGWEVPRVAPDTDFRRSLEHAAAVNGRISLYDRLREIDPDWAGSLDGRNVRRVIRALEVYRATGRRPSDLRANRAPRFNPLVMGLTMDRERLYQRIDDRVERMMAQGFLEEVERLTAAGLAAGQGALGSPGYRELGMHLSGQLELAEAVRRTKTQTHRLVRRQYAWFKPDDPRIQWLDAEDPETASSAARMVEDFLESNSPVIQ